MLPVAPNNGNPVNSNNNQVNNNQPATVPQVPQVPQTAPANN
ncbi:hypothetical protein [Psittacicella hinzii]|nr:hypothetical protein [Psittacicella hinzii]